MISQERKVEWKFSVSQLQVADKSFSWSRSYLGQFQSGNDRWLSVALSSASPLALSVHSASWALLREKRKNWEQKLGVSHSELRRKNLSFFWQCQGVRYIILTDNQKFGALWTFPTMFEKYLKCRIKIFQFWHFPPFFVLLNLTCLVTMFDRKLHFFK